MSWLGGNTLAFLSPWWLLLLLLAPWFWRQGRDSLSGLGTGRRWLALFLRTAVLALLAMAIADAQWVRQSDRFCTFFVLDWSQSIPGDAETAGGRSKAEQALKVVSDAIGNRKNPEDLAGLIVVGKDARIELPPSRFPLAKDGFAHRTISSAVDRQHTNLAAGIRQALGAFPHDCAKRIVLISDGNQNLGNALAEAAAAAKNADGKVPIDVVPIEYKYDSEILVDKVSVPPDLKKGDTATLKVAIRSAKPASGVLKITREGETGRVPVAEEKVQLNEGLTVLSVKQTIDAPDTYTYKAEFIPDPGSGDRMARNNIRSSFTTVRGPGRILLIEPQDNSCPELLAALRAENLAVVTRLPERLAENLQQFQSFDGVILANVPAERLPDPVQQALVANCRDLGAGLMMVGGADSFGAGGYKNTPLEKALPVDMEVKSTKVRGKGALVMIMHGCELPEGNTWEKDCARLAVDKMGPEDEVGILGLGGTGRMQWEVPFGAVGNGIAQKRLISRMTPSDMPAFQEGMEMALGKLLKSDATNKHVIIMSDGDPQPPTPALIAQFVQARVTVTTVCITTHGVREKSSMKNIAKATKGRAYEPANGRALPQIYIHESRIVSRPLIYENPTPWKPRVQTLTEPIMGLSADPPPIVGLVLTTAKERADVPIVSPQPGELGNVPVVAHWQYNLGRSVAVTIDGGGKWAKAWPGSPLYRRFWSQLVRWMLRPADSQNLSLAMQEKDGEVTVVVNALDKRDEFLNNLKLKATVVQPPEGEDGGVEAKPLEFRQTEPGKYEAKFPADRSGSYFLSVDGSGPDGTRETLRTGLDISYPAEYRDLESNRELLENIARVADGRVIPLAEAGDADFFPREQEPAQRLSEAWPPLLLGALLLFLFDVAVRRIAVSWTDLKKTAARVRAKLLRRAAPQADATMDRLKSVKAAASEQFKARRFEIDPSRPPADAAAPLEIPSASAPPKPAPPKPPPNSPPAGDEDTPFARLLKAKKAALDKRNDTT